MVYKSNTVVVTIGRNIDDKPMSDAMWYQFKLDAWQAVSKVFKGKIEFAELHDSDHAMWNGVLEESHKIQVFFTSHTAVTPREYDKVVKNLSNLKIKYTQEAIAVTWGRSQLV